MNNFKKALICAFALCILLSFIDFSQKCQSINNKVIRFHIPANSNSEIDQSIKLKVKDEVFEFVTMLISSATSYDESKEIINNNIQNINKKANEVLARNNASYTAEAKLTECYFKTREYDTFTLPAGEYTALTIKLGTGEGENWWCALYPSLCISLSSDRSELTDNEKELIENKEQNKISFLIYEWFLEFKKLFN